jgi:hypothetical protein
MKRYHLLVLAGLAMLPISGCNRSVSALDVGRPPEPLLAAPVGSVEAGALDPVGGPPQQLGDPNQQVAAAQVQQQQQIQQQQAQQQQVAGLDQNQQNQLQPPGARQPAGFQQQQFQQQGAVEQQQASVQQQSSGSQQNQLANVARETVTREAMAGTWTVASDNPDCRIILAFTKWSGGYRAATRRCNTAELSGVAAWDVKENRVVLVDGSGNAVASLVPAGPERYQGNTNSGKPVVFSR